MEICENDYYSADELKAYAQEMLDAFESENQSGSSEKKAEITECTVKDGTAKLLITFPDAEEYLHKTEKALCGLCDRQREDPDGRRDPVCVRGRDLKREYGRDAGRRDVLYYLQIKGSGGNPRILERRDLQFKIL